MTVKPPALICPRCGSADCAPGERVAACNGCGHVEARKHFRVGGPAVPLIYPRVHRRDGRGDMDPELAPQGVADLGPELDGAGNPRPLDFAARQRRGRG